VAINKDLKERAQKTREDGFTLKLDEGVSLAMRVSFAQDMFPGVSTEGIGVWPADDGELSVSMRGGGAVVELRAPRRPCARSRYQCGVRRANRQRAQSAGLADRITAHLLETERLPIADATLDRVTARNTIFYVRDPVATFTEFRRVLKPNGIAHVIENDLALTAVEPLGEQWRALVAAASWAWRTPDIGRKLHGIARRARLSKVSLEVQTKPDTEGRLLGMIRTVADYARDSTQLEPARIDAALELIQRSLADGTFLAIAPQFVVTAAP